MKSFFTSFIVVTLAFAAFGAGEKVAVFGNPAPWRAELGEAIADRTSADERPFHIDDTVDHCRGLRGQIDASVFAFDRGSSAPLDLLNGFNLAVLYAQTRLSGGIVLVPMAGATDDDKFVNEAMTAFERRGDVFVANGADAASVRAAIAKARRPKDPRPVALRETSYNGWDHVRRMIEKRKEILKDPVRKYDIVFFGDSITHGFDWDHPAGYAVASNRLANYRCLNIGYGADMTQHLLWRGKGGELDGYTAKMFCLMIGTNNGSRNHASKDIAAGVKAILDLIAAKHPESTTVLLPVFPRGFSPKDGLRKKNAETSRLLKPLADGKKVVWLDFNEKLMEADGTITKAMMPDALHPAAPGYEIWFREMMPLVRRYCGEGLGGNWGKPDLSVVVHASVAAEPPADRPASLVLKDGVATLSDDNGDTTANLIWRVEKGLLKDCPAKVVVLKAGNRNADPFQDVFCGVVTLAQTVVKNVPGNVPVVILPLAATTPNADFVNCDLGLENVAKGTIYYNDLKAALKVADVPKCQQFRSPCWDRGLCGSCIGGRTKITNTKVCCFGGVAQVKKLALPTNRPARSVYGCDLNQLLWRARGGDFRGYAADKVLISLPWVDPDDDLKDILAGLSEIFARAKRDQPKAKIAFVSYVGTPRMNELNAAMKDLCAQSGVVFADLKLKIILGQWEHTLGDADYGKLRDYIAAESSLPFVDADVPAGNAIVESVTADTVRLRQDMRDSADWFYWAFRVRGAAGRKIDFSFTHPYAGGPVSVRGPAVTKDRGKTWSYAAEKTSRPNGFTYVFGQDENEVWFYQTIQYLPDDWEAFLARHAADEKKTFARGALCTSRKGRKVPCARFGRLDGKAKYHLLFTSRHHCGEATATRVLEGACEAFFGADELGAWLRENVEAFVVPFVDYDGVVEGDQGKGRKPHDHNRDYTEFIYPETRAIRDWAARQEKVDMFIDFHCPWVRAGNNEYVNQVYGADEACTAQQIAFGKILERVQSGALDYHQKDDVKWMESWNTPSNYTAGKSSTGWGRTALKGYRYSSSLEIPFSKAHDKVVDCAALRAFGSDVAKAIRDYLKGGNAREFYCYDDGEFVCLLNGFEKRTRKTPPAEIKKALKTKRGYGL